MCGVRNGTHLFRQAFERVGRQFGRKIRRQRPLGVLLDAAENVGGAASVKHACHRFNAQRQPDSHERIGKHCARNRLTVDKHAVAVEDNHRSAWSFGRTAAAPTNESPTAEHSAG
jgi:hypothetical protein